MKELRGVAAGNYVNDISHNNLIVIDSGQIEGARIIQKYVRLYKERRKARLAMAELRAEKKARI